LLFALQNSAFGLCERMASAVTRTIPALRLPSTLPFKDIPASGYNFLMARGWESKSVEDQQAEAASPLDKSKPQLTPDQLAKKRESDGLILTRKSVLQQLETAQHPQHRQMLEAALAEVDGKLAKLG
jgi:hypothetical protein